MTPGHPTPRLPHHVRLFGLVGSCMTAFLCVLLLLHACTYHTGCLALLLLQLVQPACVPLCWTLSGSTSTARCKH